MVENDLLFSEGFTLALLAQVGRPAARKRINSHKFVLVFYEKLRTKERIP